MPFTCPTVNCRRTDEHDAKGCVVAWNGRSGFIITEGGDLLTVRGPLPEHCPVLGLRGTGPDEPVPDDLRADLEAAVPALDRTMPPDWAERMAASLAPLDEPFFLPQRFKP